MKNEVIRKFRSVLRIFEREVNLRNSNCTGVTLTQCHHLLEIEKQGDTNVGDLSKVMDLNKSTVSRAVDGLVSIGLVNRTIPSHNRRATIIQLTDQGKKVCDQINESNDNYYMDILSSLPENHRKIFLESFSKVTQKMSELNQYDFK